jgi:hypothetical protein
MPRQQLTNLVGALAAAQAAQRETGRHSRRGAERRRAAGAGPHPKITSADSILATVLYLRRSFPQHLLAELLGISRSRITRTITETRGLLDRHGYDIAPSTARFHAPADVIAFLADANTAPSAKPKPTC